MTIYKEDIRNCPPHDCIVSPANSFGIMDGRIDKCIAEILGQDYIIKKVQFEIVRKYYREQPIGTCLLLETRNFDLAHAPTMRIPGPLGKDTENAYLAFSAVLTKVSKSKFPIKSLLTTTFGTGTGRMPASKAVAQMKAFQKSKRDILDWNYASLANHLVASTKFK